MVEFLEERYEIITKNRDGTGIEGKVEHGGRGCAQRSTIPTRVTYRLSGQRKHVPSNANGLTLLATRFALKKRRGPL